MSRGQRAVQSSAWRRRVQGLACARQVQSKTGEELPGLCWQFGCTQVQLLGSARAVNSVVAVPTSTDPMGILKSTQEFKAPGADKEHTSAVRGGGRDPGVRRPGSGLGRPTLLLRGYSLINNLCFLIFTIFHKSLVKNCDRPSISTLTIDRPSISTLTNRPIGYSQPTEPTTLVKCRRFGRLAVTDRSVGHGRYRRSVRFHLRDNTVDIDDRFGYIYGELRSIIDRRLSIKIVLSVEPMTPVY